MKNELRKIVCAGAGITLSLAIGIVSAMKGWGLEPKSWLWIIGVNLFGQLVAQLFIELSKKD
jgi:hypothetical protein